MHFPNVQIVFQLFVSVIYRYVSVIYGYLVFKIPNSYVTLSIKTDLDQIYKPPLWPAQYMAESSHNMSISISGQSFLVLILIDRKVLNLNATHSQGRSNYQLSSYRIGIASNVIVSNILRQV